MVRGPMALDTSHLELGNAWGSRLHCATSCATGGAWRNYIASLLGATTPIHARCARPPRRT
eukprot:6131009-Pyramimonas_sp.AAC.1